MGIHDEAFYVVRTPQSPRCLRPFIRIDVARDHYRNNRCQTKVTNPRARAITGEAPPPPPRQWTKQQRGPSIMIKDPPVSQTSASQSLLPDGSLPWRIDTRGDTDRAQPPPINRILPRPPPTVHTRGVCPSCQKFSLVWISIKRSGVIQEESSIQVSARRLSVAKKVTIAIEPSAANTRKTLQRRRRQRRERRRLRQSRKFQRVLRRIFAPTFRRRQAYLIRLPLSFFPPLKNRRVVYCWPVYVRCQLRPTRPRHRPRLGDERPFLWLLRSSRVIERTPTGRARAAY